MSLRLYAAVRQLRNSVGKNGHNMNTYEQSLDTGASGPMHGLTSMAAKDGGAGLSGQAGG
jgi:hypothetical protein